MAQVISAVQEKGGSGKTTLLASLAAAFVADGAKVAIIDTDPQQNLYQWAEKEGVSIDYLAELDDTRLAPTIRQIDPNYDVIFVDTAGFKSAMAVYAIAAAGLVLIPSKATETDARGAVKTFQHVQSVGMSMGRDISAHVVLMDVDHATNITNAIVESFDEAGIPRFKALCGHRTGFKEMFTTGGGPTGSARSAFRQLLAEMQIKQLLTYYRTGEAWQNSK
ncbi:MAG: AAA family ATPase [Rhodospirillaceae bacterium]